MKFFERILNRRLYASSKKLPDRVIKFIFMDKTYILEEFSLNFNQELNQKGNPEGKPRGGIISLTFCEAPDYYINEWMCRENAVRDGEIRFLSSDIKITKGADLIIYFKDAYCIQYKKSIGKTGLFTTLTISPRKVKIRNEEFTNRWKLSEDLPYYMRSSK